MDSDKLENARRLLSELKAAYQQLPEPYREAVHSALFQASIVEQSIAANLAA
jgi:hypothetical protein